MAIGESVLLYDGERLRLLTGAAAAVWKEVDGLTGPPEIARRMAAVHADAGTVETDTMRFLLHLLEECLLEGVEGEGRPRYRLPADVAYVADEEQVILMTLGDGARRALSATGVRVWHLALAGRDAQGIVDAMRTEYPDAPATIGPQVAGLLAELAAVGLLVDQL